MARGGATLLSIANIIERQHRRYRNRVGFLRWFLRWFLRRGHTRLKGQRGEARIPNGPVPGPWPTYLPDVYHGPTGSLAPFGRYVDPGKPSW